MMKALSDRKGFIVVIGLGYVGLPLAEALSKRFNVKGYDLSEQKVNALKQKGVQFEVSADSDIMDGAECFIVAVPTPIDVNHQPDLKSIVEATKTVGRYLRKGAYVVYESTVYPGCTEELCIPMLEESAGLRLGDDFKVCYSPERISPGETSKDLGSIVKVISACDEDALDEIAELYQTVTNGLCRAPSIKVAEMAKLVENVQRDVNISLINEIAMICDKLDVDTHDVLDVAATKWNFQKFNPGLVGGHCISVDPHYLVFKSEQLGHSPRVILSGRDINDNMPAFIARKLIGKLMDKGKGAKGSRILVLGITYKPDVEDIRNSKVVDLVRELETFGMQVDVIDPKANPTAVLAQYNIELCERPVGKYDAAVIAVAHHEYKTTGADLLTTLMNGSAIVMDINGTMNDIFINETDYWRL